MSATSSTPIHSVLDLEAALIRAGFPDHAGELARMARPSAYLAGRTGESIPRVSSRLGGVPDLPPGIDWPMRPPLLSKPPEATGKNPMRWNTEDAAFLLTEQPLSFVAQANLRDVAEAIPDELGLPGDGMLYFFYDCLYQGWGFDPADAPGFKVIYAPSAKGLVAPAPPALSHGFQIFDPVELIPVRGFDPLPGQSIHFDRFGFDYDTRRRYQDALWEIEKSFKYPDGSGHKLCGWASPVQNSMEEDCALVTEGIYLGVDAYRTPKALEILARPNDWILLLQIHSDDDANMMWGDCGKLYVWIRKEDLRSLNFDKVWTVLQCS